MSVAAPSRVVSIANDTDFGATGIYLTPVVAPTLCETAVLVAAVGAGAAIAACAGYIANGWANNTGHRRGRYQDREDLELFRGAAVAGGSLAELVDARTERLG